MSGLSQELRDELERQIDSAVLQPHIFIFPNQGCAIA